MITLQVLRQERPAFFKEVRSLNANQLSLYGCNYKYKLSPKALIINYRLMQASQKAIVKTLQINNNLQLEVSFRANEIAFKYENTNDQHQTFRTTITKQSYQRMYPQMIFFCDFTTFTNNLKKGIILVQQQSQKQFIFEIQNPMNISMPIKLPFQLKMDEETMQDLLRKQLSASRVELEQFKHQKKLQMQQYQEKILNFEKTKEKQISEIYKQQNLKLQRIYFHNCKFRPIISSQMLQSANFLDKFSLIALPIQYRLQLENFKRFLLHWPKYILSVIGEAMTGKSTLLTQLQEIDEPSLNEKESDERKQGKIQLFPVSDSPSTYYDTFYCFNGDSKKLLIAKDVNTKDLLFLEQFVEQCTEMTLLCEDKLIFNEFQEESLAKAHEKARQELQLKLNHRDKHQMLENRYQVLTFNKNIFDDKYDKYIYLNKYIALLDRAGIDDVIFKDDQGMQQKQLRKIKNCTIFYCIPAAQLMTANNSIEKNLLYMMLNNQFQKIILCINCNKTRFNIDIGMKEEIYNAKFADFLIEMIETVPQFIRKVIEKQIQILGSQEKKINSKIEKTAVNSIQQKNQLDQLYNQIKSKRLQKNKFEDELTKYTNICNILKSYSEKIRALDIKTFGVTAEVNKLLQQVIQKYNFKNVYFYGLQNFQPRFQILKTLKKTSKHQFYKKIGSQTLESIQKFYFNKIQNLNNFQNQLQKYYTNLPVVIQNFMQLGHKNEKCYLNDLKNQLFKVFAEQRQLFKNVNNDIAAYKSKIVEKKNNVFTFFEKKKNWEEQLKEALFKILRAGTQKIMKIFNQYRAAVQNYGSCLKIRLHEKVTKDVYIFVNAIKSSLDLVIKQINNLTQSCAKPLVNLWNLFIKTAIADLKIFLPDKGLKDLQVPQYVGLHGSNYYRIKIKTEGQRQGFLASLFSSKEKKKSESNEKSEIKEKQEIKEIPENKIATINKQFQNFNKDSVKIYEEMKKLIEQNTNKLDNYQFMIMNLMNSSTLVETNKERKVIEDAVLELKHQYLQKLRVINYDAVLNCVNKYEQREEEKKKGWINQPQEKMP